MNVLYAASEARPFIASGGLSDVAGSLPGALCKNNVDCRVVLPLYGDISTSHREKMKYITNFAVDVSWRKQYCGLFEIKSGGVTYYFLDNEYYFKREGLYGFFDDAERFAFLSRAILEMIKHIDDFKPDIIHCNDWQTALVPAYYDLFYKYQWGYDGIKTVFTIHNIQYQGKYGHEILEEVLGIPKYAAGIVDYDKCVNMMKSAIELSSKVTTVSKTYAQEILNPWFAHGMDRLLSYHHGKLTGILNGIDTNMYNPRKDKDIFANFSAKDLSGKKVNKEGLLKEINLPCDDDLPLVGIVSRLVSHKGLDLIEYIFHEIIHYGFKVVVLGSGEYMYESFFNEMRYKYNDRVAVRLGFIPQLAKKIYAGSDMFLMPSKSEPCGLAQMISLRYGTVPIVRETGGLKDSIIDSTLGDGNGFTFASYNANDMLGAMLRAKGVYYKKDDWDSLIKHCMSCDFSWNKSAKEYIEMYEEIC